MAWLSERPKESNGASGNFEENTWYEAVVTSVKQTVSSWDGETPQVEIHFKLTEQALEGSEFTVWANETIGAFKGKVAKLARVINAVSGHRAADPVEDYNNETFEFKHGDGKVGRIKAGQALRVQGEFRENQKGETWFRLTQFAPVASAQEKIFGNPAKNPVAAGVTAGDIDPNDIPF